MYLLIGLFKEALEAKIAADSRGILTFRRIRRNAEIDDSRPEENAEEYRQ